MANNKKYPRGYFGIGIQNTKTEMNIGTLWRSASIFGASFIFTVGKRYNIPLYHYETFTEFYSAMPFDCKLIGVELDEISLPVSNYIHPERCIYLLGAEDNGLTTEAINKCHDIVQLPGEHCLNVAVAGSIIMYDRFSKHK